MNLWGWFKPSPVAGIDAMAEALGRLLSGIAQRQELTRSGSTAKAIALQRLVPQAASLTIGTYRRKDGQRDKGELHRLLNYEISDVCTGYNFWAAMYEQLFADNNAYAFRQARDTGLILRPIPRGEVSASKPNPKGNPWDIRYQWRGQTYTSDDIWHIRMHAADGMIGQKWEDELATFDLALAAEKLAYSYFANGGNVERIWKFAGLNTDGKGLASREQVADQQKLLNEILRHQAGRSGNVVVPSYFDHQNVNLSLREGQQIETRRHQSDEILKLYGIDPDKPGDLETLYTVALVPPLECVEQAITRDLLNNYQRATWKVAYVPEGRFRGAIANWLYVLGGAVKNTVMTPNEARDRSGLALDEADDGDALINPNTMPAAVSTRRDAVASGDQTNTPATGIDQLGAATSGD
jgi:HK97 family phage portal protein